MEDQVPARFQGKDFYEILGVAKNATPKEISTAYRKAALKYHPDHNHSPDANAEFAYLAKIHETLSNPEARQLYDETGETEIEADEAQGAAYDYWRSVFPRVTEKDIERFQQSYVNSPEELEDIQAAYELADGDLKTIFEYVPFADSTSFDRILKILHDNFAVSYPKKEVDRRRRQLQQSEQSEAEEAEELKQQLLSQAEQQLMLEAPNPEAGLFALIQSRGKARQNWLEELEQKYTKPPKTSKASSRSSTGTGTSRAR